MPGGRGTIREIQRLTGLAAIGILLSACGILPAPHLFGEHRTPHPSYKVGAPYEVKGIWYYPRVDYSYDQVGTASWYGAQFDGQYTANGEIFDLNRLTAAHATLPLPSIVEVVNLENNRALRIRVNDRGPFVYGRIIDLSRRAAQLLGFERTGTTRVRVRILRDESLRAAATAQRGIVSEGEEPATEIAAASAPQVAAPQSAVAMAETGVGAAALQPAASGSEAAPTQHQFFVQDPVYHVQAGPVATQQEADRLRARLIENGYRDARVVID
jgi:rare lipoprotein A